MLGKFSEENTLSTNGNFMVSIQLDIIMFLLIYRHLQNVYRFKRGASTMLVPRSIGLRIALSVETSNAESPTPM